jgi:hypothetical protein
MPSIVENNHRRLANQSRNRAEVTAVINRALNLFSGPYRGRTLPPYRTTAPEIVRPIQRPPQCGHADAEQRRSPGLRFIALCDQLPCMLDLVRRQFRRPADVTARRFAAFIPALVRSEIRERSNSANAPMM